MHKDEATPNQPLQRQQNDRVWLEEDSGGTWAAGLATIPGRTSIQASERHATISLVQTGECCL